MICAFSVFVIRGVLYGVGLYSRGSVRAIQGIQLRFFGLFHPLNGGVFGTSFVYVGVEYGAGVHCSLVFGAKRRLRAILGHFYAIVCAQGGVEIRVRGLRAIRRLGYLAGAITRFIATGLYRALFVSVKHAMNFGGLYGDYLGYIYHLTLVG